MTKNILAMTFLACLVAGCSTKSPSPKPPADPLADFQRKAKHFHSVVQLPVFETTPEDVSNTVDNTITMANQALDEMGRLNKKKVTFENTIRAMDDIAYTIGLDADRLDLIKETSTNADVRDAATEVIKKLEEWTVGVDYRDDVYASIKAYAATKPNLSGEDKKLFEETLRDYRRAGLDLPKAQRDNVEQMRKDLTKLETDFESNVTKAEKSLKFTKAELDGVPEDFLAQEGIKTGDDEYTLKANITFHYIMVEDNASREDTRKKMLVAQYNLAREENIPLLQKILVLRDQIAHALGYATYADYATEVRMVKNAKTAIDFEEKLEHGLQPKYDAELEEFRQLKIKQTGDTNAIINVWDWRYFANELKKTKYNVDAEQLRVYFPYQRVLDGMFAIYQHIFGLKFQRVEAPYKWIDDLQLYTVSDAKTGEPMGMFYLDMFPREGKYNHFAQFGIIEGKQLPDGTYQRPVCALICNFPPPQPDKPSLLSHDEVETIFHEFGHAMHTILTRAKYSRFSGTSVPTDFVEAPSQMLENWAWDKKVLDSFAADYRDPSKKIPQEILSQLKASRLATEGTFYRRQLSFGLMDLMLHTQIHESNADDTLPLANKVLSDVSLPVPPDSAFPAYFGHIIGYGAGYYGYAWADAIAADMATVFEKTPDGFFDVQAGMRLRKEIYEVGDSRDINISIEKFLGRPRSIQPFLKKIGINDEQAK
ncbi:MAG TPA: M3 family metallopeptidase [Verrucomicrobiae bacterium]|nr:M3 family metallopeptidase [Verrucomicrobiae bacterium]